MRVSGGTGTPRRPAKTQASKDRDAVNNVSMLIVCGLINQFTSSPSDLLNIATGKKCASLDLLEAELKKRSTQLLLRYVCRFSTRSDRNQ